MRATAIRTIDTALEGVKLLFPLRHSDARGFFSETYRTDWFPEYQFVQDNHSLSQETGTMRGLHFQQPPRAQAKLIRVARGRIFDVAVDIRADSPTFRHHVAVELSAEGGEQLLIPEGFAHGFLTLEENTEVLYKVTDYYSAEHDSGILWSDPDLGIEWPMPADAMTISDRDLVHPLLTELPPIFMVST